MCDPRQCNCVSQTWTSGQEAVPVGSPEGLLFSSMRAKCISLPFRGARDSPRGYQQLTSSLGTITLHWLPLPQAPPALCRLHYPETQAEGAWVCVGFCVLPHPYLGPYTSQAYCLLPPSCSSSPYHRTGSGV